MSKTVIDEYFFYQEKYSKLYNENTIVFMMIGGFYEAYSTNTRGFDLNKISEVAGLVKTKRDKKIDTVDMKNPYMVGFKNESLTKYLKILIDSGFTVVVVSQITPPPNPKRAVTGVYSIGTYIDENSNPTDNNNIISMYIDDEKQLDGGYLSCIGLSSVDLSTGVCSVYEIISKPMDQKYALDEAYRFIIAQNPKEIIISRKIIENLSMSKDNLIKYLELENKTVHYSEIINKNFNKISYQNEFLSKIYKNIGIVTPIEYLDLEKINYARFSFIILLDFCYKHNEQFINHLHKPQVFENNEHLILGNNAIYQLNILENDALELNNIKFKSLYDVVNNASTPLGKRFIKTAICNPLNDPKEINFRYNCTEELINNNLYLTIEKELEYILDIERLIRRVYLSSIQPYDLANLFESFNYIENIYKLIESTKYNSKYLPDKQIITQLNDFLTEFKKMFNIDELKKQNINDITASFFNKNMFSIIDELEDKMGDSVQSMEEICNVLSTYINEGKGKVKNNSPKIQLKKNSRDGYYLFLSKKRSDLLKSELNKHEKIMINETFGIDPKNLEFVDLVAGKTTKIFFKDLKSKSNDAVAQKEKLISLIKKKYYDILTQYSNKYKKMFNEIIWFISKLDFTKSNAKTAKMYNYCKPNLIVSDKSYFKSTKMRHPIIERLRTDTEYIPHDISLGDDSMDGMILFGFNSAGKSSMMKSIGINLIMAQCGMYVACQSYEYSPYNSLYARITGNDNQFKGQSSFVLEMTELDTIIKRSDKNTLVVGDEVCRGTEHISGNAIVATSIVFLSQCACSFIFASHLHELATMDEITCLNNVKIFHLEVKCDENDTLIFDRILKPGPGNSDYGLTVAKSIIKNPEFIKLAQKIKNKLLKRPNEILNTKTSKYNSNVFINECQICKKSNDESNEKVGKLDTHHILNQQHCKEGFSIEKSHIATNSKCNLVVLCKLCHYKAHHNQLNIKGYKETSKGRILDYNIINK